MANVAEKVYCTTIISQLNGMVKLVETDPRPPLTIAWTLPPKSDWGNQVISGLEFVTYMCNHRLRWRGRKAIRSAWLGRIQLWRVAGADNLLSFVEPWRLSDHNSVIAFHAGRTTLGPVHVFEPECIAHVRFRA